MGRVVCLASGEGTVESAPSVPFPADCLIWPKPMSGLEHMCTKSPGVASCGPTGSTLCFQLAEHRPPEVMPPTQALMMTADIWEGLATCQAGAGSALHIQHLHIHLQQALTAS